VLYQLRDDRFCSKVINEACLMRVVKREELVAAAAGLVALPSKTPAGHVSASASASASQCWYHDCNLSCRLYLHLHLHPSISIRIPTQYREVQTAMSRLHMPPHHVVRQCLCHSSTCNHHSHHRQQPCPTQRRRVTSNLLCPPPTPKSLVLAQVSQQSELVPV
jgi:hypothetical protein